MAKFACCSTVTIIHAYYCYFTTAIVIVILFHSGSKPVHIGYFDSQQDAARAYDQEAIRLRGPNTSLNYPITDYDVSMPFPFCTPAPTELCRSGVCSNTQAPVN